MKPAQTPSTALALAALLFLPACWGGSAGNSAGNISAPPPPAPSGDVTPPPRTFMLATTPLTSGMLTDFDMASTTSGGIARLATETIDPSGTIMPSTADAGVTFANGRLQVDGKEAVLLVMTDTDINALLQDPLTTQLLMDDATIDYSSARPTINDNPAGMTPHNARGASNSGQSGVIYQPSDASEFVVYIDDHAAVVMGYEASLTNSNPEFTMIGEQFSSRMPTTVDAFSGTYSGLAAVAADSGLLLISESAPFKMGVDFDTAMDSFTADFTADFETDGMVTATDIPIDLASGTFASDENSTVTFTAGSDMTGVIYGDRASTSGNFLGQFHGEDASGVTGAFHNSDNSLLGGFAGSKE